MENYEDTPTKECGHCEGKGFHLLEEDDVALTEDCTHCNGTGVVDMTDEEIQFEHECNLDHYAEQ